MTPSASQAERIIMSEHTHMPPRLDRPWNFGSWDNMKTSTPPWEHRGFGYHGETGDRLVIVWRYGFDEGGYQIVCGDIYRCTDMLEAIKLCDQFREQVDRDNRHWGAGMLIFFGNRRACESSVYGESFPEPLPNGRWL